MKLLQEEINFYLKDFYRKLQNSPLNCDDQIKALNLILDMSSIHNDIHHVTKRINSEIKVIHPLNLEFNRKFQKNSSASMKVIDEFLLINMDIKPLYLFFLILIDKIPKFLNLLFVKGHSPRDRSFEEYKKSIRKYEGGEEFKKLKSIILSYWLYHKEIKNFRDDCIVHHSIGKNPMAYGEDNLWFVFGYEFNNEILWKTIDIDKIQSHITLMLLLFRDIATWLDYNLANIYFEMKPKTNSKKT